MNPPQGRGVGNPLLILLVSISLVVYPLAIYWLLDTLGIRVLGFVLVALLLIRFWPGLRQSPRLGWLLAGAVLIYAALLVGVDSQLVLTLYPAGMNLGLAILFISSLVKPPTVIERVTRLTGSEISSRARSRIRTGSPMSRTNNSPPRPIDPAWRIS